MSNEQDRATYYEAHKDDPEEWGEAPEPAKPRRRLASMISVRLAPDEAAVVRKAAERLGLSISAFMRQAVLAAASRELSADRLQVASTSASNTSMTLVSAPPAVVDLHALGATATLVPAGRDQEPT